MDREMIIVCYVEIPCGPFKPRNSSFSKDDPSTDIDYRQSVFPNYPSRLVLFLEAY